MHIRRVQIEWFRGIRKLEWTLSNPVSCLIGPGDSTKTTILDAVEYALSPRWNISFADTDFHMAKVGHPILITVTVGGVPQQLLSDNKFGRQIRGWTSAGKLRDEPEDEDEVVISVKLRVDDTLEPSWFVVSDRDPEGIRISHNDRRLFGVARLGTDIDHHLSWGRTSALTRLTSSMDDATRVVNEAIRKTCEMISKDGIPDLAEVAQLAQSAATRFGIGENISYCPALDTEALFGRAGTIAIHDGAVPVRLAGFGSRRLLALALQCLCVKDGAIVLVDEIEHGLEPYRIRHLLRMLRSSIKPTSMSSNFEQCLGQVITTTHSPVVLREMDVSELSIVRSKQGITTVTPIDFKLKETVREVPEALLSPKVIVCEGKTEMGFLRVWEKQWCADRKGVPLAHTGTAIELGVGTAAVDRAKHLARLGYQVAYFGDSDRSVDVKGMETIGVTVVCWDDNYSIEERVCADLPLKFIQAFIDSALIRKSEDSIQQAVAQRLGINSKQLMGTDVTGWFRDGLTEQMVRQAIGQAAKHKDSSWFKSVESGEKLAEIVRDALPSLTGTDLADKLQMLGEWAYANRSC